MLKISGKSRFVLKTVSKLVLAMVIGCVSMLTLLFVWYSPTYKVEFNGEDLGYVAKRRDVQNRIRSFVEAEDIDNIGYVILNSEPTYELTLVKKGTQMNDDAVVEKVIDSCDVYYRIYGINVNGEEKFVVENIKEAQEIVEEINNSQDDFVEKAEIEISEKFVMKYDLLDDVEVVVNDIVDDIEEENNKVIRKNNLYAASSRYTIPEKVLQALKESNEELNFRRPLDTGVITSRYGIRSLGNHKGLDIGAPIGTDIYAAEDGIVTYSGWMNGYGYLIVIQHASGFQTYYGHCSKLISSVGDEVQKGDLIALVGNTGRSTGPHCHFEVRIDGITYNPELFL